jgi:prevent-host-death family protein
MPEPENKLFTKSLPAFLARTQFGQILERVSKHHDRFLVTKNGEATAVILGVDDFLQAIATTPESLAALHAQARRSGAARLSLEDIEAEIAAVRAEHRPSVS